MRNCIANEVKKHTWRSIVEDKGK